MSFQDPPREPRPARKPRARISLKMQAIGFLSRREHSRQELRAKLLDSLRKRAREEAALVAAADKAARELAQALSEQSSNGIDDAFAPSTPAPAARGRAGADPARATRPSAARVRSSPHAGAREDADLAATRQSSLDRPALATLSLANGAPLPAALQASLADTAAAPIAAPSARGRAGPTSSSAAPSTPLAHRVPATEAFDDFIDADAARLDAPDDDLPERASASLDATDLELTDPEAAVDQLLDWLVANKYLSETRFVESRVNARSRKQGALLIKLELARHGLALEPEQAATLRETEFARAQALWQRKFGEVAPDARLRAKQARFLAARGFAAEVVRRVVGGEDEF